MSDALRNFLFLKDPLAKGYSITVTQAELEALLEAHDVGVVAPLREEIAALERELDEAFCPEAHCADGDCDYN